MANYYPPVSFAYQVRISGDRSNLDTGFQEVSGLDVERTITEIKEGGENRFSHQVPGALKYQSLKLKRGLVVANSPVYAWYKESLESDLQARVTTKDLTVSLLDEKAMPLMSWSIIRAWPLKWSISDFRAQENEVAIETLELSFQRMERKIIRSLSVAGLV